MSRDLENIKKRRKYVELFTMIEKKLEGIGWSLIIVDIKGKRLKLDKFYVIRELEEKSKKKKKFTSLGRGGFLDEGHFLRVNGIESFVILRQYNILSWERKSYIILFFNDSLNVVYKLHLNEKGESIF